jgi:hypothetical protein
MLANNIKKIRIINAENKSRTTNTRYTKQAGDCFTYWLRQHKWVLSTLGIIN